MIHNECRYGAFKWEQVGQGITLDGGLLAIYQCTSCHQVLITGTSNLDIVTEEASTE